MRHDLILTTALLAAAFVPVPLIAQQEAGTPYPVADVAFGVTLNDTPDVNTRPRCTELQLPCTSPKTFGDAGLVTQVAVHPIRNAALVAEGSIWNNMWLETGHSRSSVNHVGAFLVGPRLMTGTISYRTKSDTTRFRIFAQVLWGRERSTVVPTRFAVQPGVGLEGKLPWRPAWLRFSYDYRRTHGSGRNLSGDRILAALVLSVPGGK